MHNQNHPADGSLNTFQVNDQSSPGAGLANHENPVIIQCAHSTEIGHTCGEISGALSAHGGKGAGIGGTSNEIYNAGNITINGGHITAWSALGAGIGGAYSEYGKIPSSSGQNITINGGIISASSENGAGIGGALLSSGNDITINGGTVSANSKQGAGIGGGPDGSGSNNTISGGSVNAASVQGLLADHPASDLVFTLKDAQGKPLANQPVAGLKDAEGNDFVAYDGEKIYGENGIRTDKDGKIYLWPKSPSHREYVTATSNGVLYMSDQDGNLTPPLYTLSYDLNNGTGSVPDKTSAPLGSTIPLNYSPTPSANSAGYVFAGWDTDANSTTPTYTANGTTTFKLTEDTTLYAIYAPVYTLSYDANGGKGSVPADASYLSGETTPVVFSPAPEKTGYHFIGWDPSALAKTPMYQDSGLKNLAISADTTLYAIWKKTSGSGGGGSAFVVNPIQINTTTPDNSTLNGEMILNRPDGKPGDIILMTPKPEAGYHLADLNVFDAAGNALALTKNSDGTIQFTMPGTAVRIEPSFAPDAPAIFPHFDDVAQDAWYADSIRYVSENKLMVGTSENQFSPNLSTSRAMVVSILYRLAGEPAVNGAVLFSDVQADDWYATPIIWAAQNKVVAGYPDGTFDPNGIITREQLMCMLHNDAKLKGYDTTGVESMSGFFDEAKVSDYARPAMQWAVQHGMIRGMGDGQLAPAADTTRAQLATIIQRYMETFVQ